MKKILAAVLAILFAGDALAGQVEDAIKASLQKQFPNVTITNVIKVPLADHYEVDAGQQIAYTNATGSFILAGSLIDPQSRSNLTVERRGELDKIEFSTLPLQDAIKVVKGDGQKKIAVFADPDCPHCKRLEATLQGFDNATIYTFLIPVLGPDSKAKATSIWCSTDRAATWETWMLKQQVPSGTDCDASVLARNLALARKLHVLGTPTVFLDNGHRLVGEVPLAALDEQGGHK
jgi:thiol:disulfide interchange protein DsbC